MAFMGVRMSWLMLERNSCLAALACSASFRAASISTFIRRSSATWFLYTFKYWKNRIRSMAMAAKEAA